MGVLLRVWIDGLCTDSGIRQLRVGGDNMMVPFGIREHAAGTIPVAPDGIPASLREEILRGGGSWNANLV